MAFGSFNQDGSEYHLTTLQIPRFWHNYLHNSEYGLTLAQTGHGYSWFDSPVAYKLTRNFDTNYSATDPRQGRFLYLHDLERKSWWNATPLPGAPCDHYCCKVGQGYSILEGEAQGIRTEALFFVPPQDKVELWRVAITNRSSRTRSLRLFNYLEWFLGSYPGTWTDPLVYVVAQFLRKPGIMWMYNANPDSLVMYAGIMAADPRPDGFDTGRNFFLGNFGSHQAPEAVQRGACTNSLVSGEPFCGAFQHDLTLKPGQTRTVTYLIGVAQTQPEATALQRKYLGGRRTEKAYRALRRYRQELVETAVIATPEPEVDRYFNYWLKNQLLIVRNWTRFLYRGYRDVLQDLRGSMSLEPQWSRRLLLKTLQHQYPDGTAPRQYNEQGGDHDLRNYMDSPSWIPDTLVAYIKESGDRAVLDEVLPYLKPGTTRGYQEAGQGTVWEHALAAVRCLQQHRGRHGLCLVGHGDWNDALNCVGHGGAGESVWLSCAFCYACLKLIELADHIGDRAVAAEMRAYYTQMKETINREAWDGRWYVYAFDDRGQPIGSRKNKCGRTHLNVQSWAVFAGVAEGERLKRVLKRIDEMDTPYGPLLLTPAYTDWDPHVGRITTMVPGFFENGSIYTHGAAFKMRADLAANRPEQALETFRKVTPLNPQNPAEHSTLEPYGLSNFFIGPDCPNPKKDFGRTIYSFNSGSGNWLYVNLLEELLGVAADFDGLRIRPNPPRRWKQYRVVRKWRKATYEIEFVRSGRGRGVRSIRCDGRALKGDLLPVFADGRRHKVTVRFG